MRLGQKTREEAMDELEDEIDEFRVQDLMKQIGFVMPDEQETAIKRLAAWYVSDKPLTPAELRAFLGKDLPDYMLPSHFVKLEKLPITSNGKVDRRGLPAVSEADAPATRDVVPPRTDTEKALAAIWSQLLNVQTVGINDDFFELGAQSLLAIRAVSRIRDAFGVDVALRNLFERPTVAGLAEVIDGLSWVANGSSSHSPAGNREDFAL